MKKANSNSGCPRLSVCCLILIIFFFLIWNLNHFSRSISTSLDPIKSNNNNANELQTNQTSTKSQLKKNHVPIHTVFSTDCSFYQDWQTLVVFHSAKQVGQEGTVTRIASGCTKEKQQVLHSTYKKLYPEYRVHFTPDFKSDNATKQRYQFYNKPFGMQHWFAHSLDPIPDNSIIILVDPDFIFLRPIQVDFGKDKNVIPTKLYFDVNYTYPTSFGKGKPVAQLYGIGAQWTIPDNKNFNSIDICGRKSPCLTVGTRYGEEHYSVGPPYVLEKSDFKRLTNTWTDFVPRVYKKYPELLAEMYAYSMAAAHEKLPHAAYEHFMVSNTDMYGEGWPFIDVLEDKVCVPPVNGLYYPSVPLPNFLHFCQEYRIAELHLYKSFLPSHKMLDCRESYVPLADPLPSLSLIETYRNGKGEIIKMTRKQSRRNAFMLCILHQEINDAVRHYRDIMCTFNSTVPNLSS